MKYTNLAWGSSEICKVYKAFSYIDTSKKQLLWTGDSSVELAVSCVQNSSEQIDTRGIAQFYINLTKLGSIEDGVSIEKMPP